MNDREELNAFIDRFAFESPGWRQDFLNRFAASLERPESDDLLHVLTQLHRRVGESNG
jgi:hypothetical protein